MSKTKVSFFEVTSLQKEYLTSKLSKSFDLSFFRDTLNEQNVTKVKNAEFLGIFISSQINKKILDELPNLKLISTMSTGFDHIDLAETKKRGVVVANVPFYGENTVAEHTFALLLCISRKIIESNAKAKRGNFDPKGLMGFDLKGKTIGIIGTGSIGKNVVKIACGFSMKVLAFDLNKDLSLEKDYGVKYVTIDELFKNSDIITLHVPYNKNTHHLINKSNINLLKKGAVIINTARGGLIETEALYEALTSGHIKAAGLDVLEEEGFLKEEAELLCFDSSNCNLKTVVANHILINHPNVIVTPHSAFNSKEAIKRILDTTIKNIVGFRLNKIQNVVP